MATKKLKTGDRIAIKDRLWAVVDSTGRLVPGIPMAIFSRRAEAKDCAGVGLDRRILRVFDVSGIVQ